MLISYEDAQVELSEYFDSLWGIVNEAWNDYQKETSAKSKIVFTSRSRASNVHDYMVWNARKYCETRENVEVRCRQSMCVLIIERQVGTFAIRFKKLDEVGLSKNQLTGQVALFREQSDLPGISPAHHLEVGYILNKDESEIIAIEMVCPSGVKRNSWRCEITPLAGDNLGEVVPFEPNQPNGPRNVVVRRKDSAIDLDQDGTNSK
jgi:hypothetical protein